MNILIQIEVPGNLRGQLIRWDVINGRNRFNFSEWDKNPGGLGEMIEKIQDGGMPPIQYTIAHPGSRMDAQQKQALIDALTTSIGQ